MTALRLFLLAFFGAALLVGCPPVTSDDDDSAGDDDDATGDDDDATGDDDDATGDDDDATGDDDDATGDHDDATGDDDDATGDDDDATGDDDDATGDDDDSASGTGGTATLTGTVTRSVDVEHDGVGDLYVAVFDGNPVDLLNTPNMLGYQQIPATDLNPAGVAISYSISGLVPGAVSPFHVIAFFDDNGNASGVEPAPDQSDLVSLDGLAAPTVELPDASGATLDLELNFAMLF